MIPHFLETKQMTPSKIDQDPRQTKTEISTMAFSHSLGDANKNATLGFFSPVQGPPTDRSEGVCPVYTVLSFRYFTEKKKEDPKSPTPGELEL